MISYRVEPDRAADIPISISSPSPSPRTTRRGSTAKSRGQSVRLSVHFAQQWDAIRSCGDRLSELCLWAGSNNDASSVPDSRRDHPSVQWSDTMTESKRRFVLFGGERLFTFKSWARVTSDAAFLRQSQKLAAAAGKGNSIFRFRYSSHVTAAAVTVSKVPIGGSADMNTHENQQQW